MSRIQTVLGVISPEKLGHTLTHEHMSMVFNHFQREPPQHLKHIFETNDIRLSNAGYVRQYPYSLPYNLIFNDADAKDAVLNDVKEYKRCGGGAIVENTTVGISRDSNFLRSVSEATGVHVVAGSGYYISDTWPAGPKVGNKEEYYEHMLKEMTVGCEENTNVKAGFLGEIASNWPITEMERNVIRATGEVQEQVRCGVSFHPHREPDAPFEIIRLYLEAGGRADKAVMSHLDRTIFDSEKLLTFSELGTYCQFDLFGIEVSVYQLNIETDMPSDAQRLDQIKLLVDDGKENRVLMSHDIHTKHRLTTFGGHGYAHIINNVLPKMKIKGFSQNTIDNITVVNPANWLAIH